MSKRKRKKKKIKLSPMRNFNALVAWFRSSAGPMKDKKKDKKRRRQWKQRNDKFDD